MTSINKNISEEVYSEFLNEIVSMVQNYRVLAVYSVQTISNQLYWNIGELILNKQNEYGWGKSIVEKISKDLNNRIGEGISWSPRNLWFMRQLVAEYSDVKQAVSDFQFLKQLVSEVPWGQNILIIQKVKDIKARIFYLESTIKNKYSRSVLLHQIKADAYGKYLQNPSDDKPSIGILLVPHKDRLEVEYALRIASKPIGVGQYTYVKKFRMNFWVYYRQPRNSNKLLNKKRN